MSRLTTKNYSMNWIDNMTEKVCLNRILKKVGRVEDFEDELGISFDTLINIFKKGIWSKEHLSFPNKYSRQTSPFSVELYKEDDGWVFYFNPTSYGSGNEYGPAHIFYDSVYVKDYNETYSVTKSIMLNKIKEEKQNGKENL